MRERPSCAIAVVLEREVVESRWVSHAWNLHGVMPEVGGEVRVLFEDARRMQRLHPGFVLQLYQDEAEGYYLNSSSEAPSVFVSLRTDEATGDVQPFQATLSYNEAARWMDGGERVERAPAWPELTAWMTAWVAENYRPEPKRRRKPRSFEGKEGKLREEGSS
jgi:hypothetical protein